MKERIKELRKTLGYTQTEFAEKLGISNGTIGNYEVGTRTPANTTIKFICNTYNVNEEWLRTGKGEMFNDDNNVIQGENLFRIALDRKLSNFVNSYLKLTTEKQNVIWDFIEDLANKNSTD